MKHLLILLFFIAFNEEDGIIGEYCYNKDYSQTCIEFFKKNHFRYEHISYSGVIKGSGNYQIRNDSLHLNFEDQEKNQNQTAAYLGGEEIITDTIWSDKILELNEKRIILKDKNSVVKYKAVVYVNEDK